MDYRKEYKKWLDNTEGSVKDELLKMAPNEQEDAFYRDLSFGTGGLRGIIGAGTNRMNVYVVRKASQGLANYMKKKYYNPTIIIGYDSRINSELFAKTAASVFAANGITVYIWPYITPVPMVSFAIRYFHASQGVMITASHNPSNYNGYKVYGTDGCQITTYDSDCIISEINNVDIFTDINIMDFDEACKLNKIIYIDDTVMTSYINTVKKESVLFGDKIEKKVSIVYTPLNGTGLIPIMKILKESGFSNITVVEEQKNPDGKFPTCPYPNPEIREAMDLGLEYCKNTRADILIATDPDADRCGIAIKMDSGEYKLLSGNEVGILLLDYICYQRTKHNEMPDYPVFIKTIVTTDLAEKIATFYGVRTINVLTGFKFIGEQINLLNDKRSFIFGFEESYGYLTGSYVRDKDGINATFIICEMLAFYKYNNINLMDKLEQLYKRFGYFKNTLYSFEFPGCSGLNKMNSIITRFRSEINNIGGLQVLEMKDYVHGLDGLPSTNMIKLELKNEYKQSCSVVIRPSGTEPKLKVYISVSSNSEKMASLLEKNIIEEITSIINN